MVNEQIRKDMPMAEALSRSLRTKRRARAVRWILLFSLLLIYAIAGCKKSPPASDASRAGGELIVSAAASLRDAFNEIGRLYESREHTKVRFNYGASGALEKQIEASAPVDVFASAGAKQMDDLIAKDLIIEGSRQDFARNALVLITPADAPVSINSFADLDSSQVRRIAIGNPQTVPAGQYTEQTLTNLKLWQQLQPKLILAEDVRQVLDYVVRGEVQAGIVYASDAYSAGFKVKAVALAPENSHDPILYPIAVIRESRQPEVARKFIALVLSAEGQRVLTKYGFISVR